MVAMSLSCSVGALSRFGLGCQPLWNVGGSDVPRTISVQWLGNLIVTWEPF
jgi:hypothetical protein